MTVVTAEQAAPSAEALALRAQNGQREAFEQLVERYEARIFHYLCSLVGNRHDAEDLTQETFVKAYLGLRHYDSDFGFTTWLFTIAKRAAATFYRRARPDLNRDERSDVDLDDPALLLDRKDQSRSLWNIARTLKPNQFEALWLRYGEGLSVAEVAQIMQMTGIHVKVLLHRARRQLAKTLEPGDWNR
jgi:RNA polymerase sigma-70 factor, ECF subfamily